MTTVRLKPSPRIWLWLILLAAFALRLFRLGVASLWYDETISVFLARQDLVSLTRHTAGDIHPPLYYYLLHFWGNLAGWSEFSVAFLSLFLGVLLIALVYRVARDLSPIPSPARRRARGEVALLAAFLVAISPYNLWYSQEVRMYTLGAVLGLASVYCFVRLFRPLTTDRRPRIFARDLAAYAIVSALGLYTLYYFVFLLVFENLAALTWIIRNLQFTMRSKSEIINLKSEIGIWLLSQLTILILYLPWLPIAFRQATDPPVPPWRSFTPLPNVLLESFSALALGQSVNWTTPSPIWFVLCIIAIVIAIALWINNGRRFAVGGLFLLGNILVPLLLIYVFSIWKPLYHVRYVFIYSPGFYILLAAGISRISGFRFQVSDFASRIAHYASLFTFYFLLFTFTVASVYSASNFWFDPQYQHDDLRGAMKYLADHWRPGDAVLINAGYTYTAFAYYYAEPIAWRGRLVDYPPRDISTGTVQRLVDQRAGAIVLQTGSLGGSASLGWGSAESDFYATTADETRAALDRVFAFHPRVWMLRLYDTVVDPDGVVRDYLAQRGRIIDDQGFAGESFARVQGYLTTRSTLTELPATAARREVLLGNRIVLLGFDSPSALVQAGAPLDVNVYWQAKEPTNVDAHLFIGLFAADGKLVASSDEIPVGNALGTSRWTPGEILREPVRLIVPANVSPDNYILRVALYIPLTNEPLGASTSEWSLENGQVELTNVRVEK